MTYGTQLRKEGLVHPLWTHLPALAIVLVLVGYYIHISPLPASVPVHFNGQGVPNGYGPPWTFLIIGIGAFVLFTGISITMDEAWARREKKKFFNWFSLMDEIIIAWVTGTSLGYLAALQDGSNIIQFPWFYGLGMMGGAAVLGVLLELLRPYRQYHGKEELAEPLDFKKNIARQVKDESQFVYWENQNTAWVTLVSLVLPLIFISTSIIVWAAGSAVFFASLYTGVAALVTIAAIVFIYGGQRVIVNRQDLSVCWGMAGLKVLRLNTAGIVSVETMEFSPLADFGGYGIRFGRGIKAYFLRGDRGVKITMVNGKKYLIGSDHAEHLLAVLELITGKK